MIRTEADLQDVLLARADRAPAEAPVLDWLDQQLGGHHAHTSRPARPARRVLLPLAAAAAVAAAALVSVWWTSGSAPAHRQESGSISANTTEPTAKAFFAYSFRLDSPPSGVVLESRQIEPDRQTIVYSSDRAVGAVAGEPDVIEAVVYRKGAFDPATVRAGTKVSVHGTRGYYGPALAHVRAPSGDEATSLVPSVAWRYAPNSWAVVTGVTAAYRDEAHELAVAGTVHPAAGAAPRLAFRIGYLPAGLRATRILDDLGPASTASFGRGPSTDVVTIAASYAPDQAVRGGFGTATPPLMIGGHPAELVDLSEGGVSDGHSLEIIRGGYWLTIGGDATVSAGELRAIALGLTLAPDAGHDAGWFTAETALPH